MMTTMLMIGIMVTTILSIWHIDKQEEDHDDDNHVDDQDHGDDHIDKQEEDHGQC